MRKVTAYLVEPSPNTEYDFDCVPYWADDHGDHQRAVNEAHKLAERSLGMQVNDFLPATLKYAEKPIRVAKVTIKHAEIVSPERCQECFAENCRYNWLL